MQPRRGAAGEEAPAVEVDDGGREVALPGGGRAAHRERGVVAAAPDGGHGTDDEAEGKEPGRRQSENHASSGASLDGLRSRVWQQAENRMHAARAVLVAVLDGER